MSKIKNANLSKSDPAEFEAMDFKCTLTINDFKQSRLRSRRFDPLLP